MLKDRHEEPLMEALDLDELENVTGGAKSNHGEGGPNGKVIEALPNAQFKVDVGGPTVVAHVSGKLRMNYVRIRPGDKVRVEGSRIVYVYR